MSCDIGIVTGGAEESICCLEILGCVCTEAVLGFCWKARVGFSFSVIDGVGGDEEGPPVFEDGGGPGWGGKGAGGAEVSYC